MNKAISFLQPVAYGAIVVYVIWQLALQTVIALVNSNNVQSAYRTQFEQSQNQLAACSKELANRPVAAEKEVKK